MKTRLILLITLLLNLSSCNNSDSDSIILEVSKSNFANVSATGETLTVDVSSNSSWTISGANQWCISDKQTGLNSGKITLTITTNNEQKERSATLIITAEKITRTIKITQQAITLNQSDLTTFHFQIPVVFHVLYKDKNSTTQYAKEERINQILAQCNKYYQNAFGNNSSNIGVEFILATEDPDGKVLTEPGIDRVLWDSPEMDCVKFMSSKNNKKYLNLLWDTDRYINIMLYTFVQTETGGTILGISTFPYTIQPDQLDGLNQINFIPTHSSLTYPHCVSINNSFINSEFSIQGSRYSSVDIAITLAHELGHYLGLYHTFSESSDESDDTCKDTDYCTDTPTYDRAAYIQYMEHYIAEKSKDSEIKWEDYMKLMERRDCLAGTITTPNNVMDYDISWCNRFTPQQKERMRYVLSHSPLIPGPKVKRAITRVASTPTPLPMRIIQ